MTKKNVTTSSAYNLRNHFLIANPGLDDPMFGQSLTYICEHSAEGAMGLIINRPMPLKFSDILAQLDLSCSAEGLGSQPILAGGPVNTERGFVLHTPSDHEWQSSIRVSADLALTASRDIIDAIAKGEGPYTTQFILGYAGWGAGQLEEEIKENSWLTAPANLDILFNTPADQRWGAAAKSLGIDIRLMSSQTGHA